MRCLVLSVIAAVVLLDGCQRDISGTYLASDKVAVCWLQLVRTPDNHLTGQLDASVLKSDGKIERSSTSVTGAVDGENVSLSGGGFLGLQPTALSGVLEGNNLTLTGIQTTPFILKRSSLKDYQARLSELSGRSQTILTSKANAYARQQTSRIMRILTSQIDQAVGEMGKFGPKANLYQEGFPRAEKKYHAITQEIARCISNERRLAGNPNASVSRGQLDVAANQAAIATNQLHNTMQSLQFSFEANVRPLMSKTDNLEQACHVAVSSGELMPAQNNERITACQQLAAADAHFRQEYSFVSAGFARTEQTYKREHDAQQALIQSARRFR